MAALTIIIADDHPLFRGALRQAVDGMEGHVTIIEAGDFDAARKAASEHSDADVMLLDLAMPAGGDTGDGLQVYVGIGQAF